jgi:hypothetical protein
MKKQIPYYEQTVNQYFTGEITKPELLKLCKENGKLKEWVEHHVLLTAAIKELKATGKI